MAYLLLNSEYKEFNEYFKIQNSLVRIKINKFSL